MTCLADAFPTAYQTDPSSNKELFNHVDRLISTKLVIRETLLAVDT